MSPNKNKKTSRASSHSDRQNRGMRRVFLTGFWLVLICVGLWALMNYSTQSSELVPYVKVNNTEPAPGKDDTPPVNRGKKSGEQDIPAGDLIQKASDSISPRPNLPRETLEFIAKGMDLTEKGLSNQANLEFAKAAELSPQSPELFSIWGAAMRMQKKYKGANKKFARAHELAPGDEEITFNWGLSRLEEQNHDEAVKLFEKTVQLAPNNYMALNYLGKSYGRKKLYKMEMDSYRKALAIKPDFAQAHFNLGVVLSLRKKFEEAAPHFEKAIELDKSFEKPFVVQMLTAMGRYQAPASEKNQTQNSRASPGSQGSASQQRGKEV